MIIDIVSTEGCLYRYDSNIIPRVGETISMFKPEKKCFSVLTVDYSIRPDYMAISNNLENAVMIDLVTIGVEEIEIL